MWWYRVKKCQEEQHLVQLEQDLQLVLQQDQQEQQEQQEQQQ